MPKNIETLLDELSEMVEPPRKEPTVWEKLDDALLRIQELEEENKVLRSKLGITTRSF